MNEMPLILKVWGTVFAVVTLLHLYAHAFPFSDAFDNLLGESFIAVACGTILGGLCASLLHWTLGLDWIEAGSWSVPLAAMATLALVFLIRKRR